MLRPVSAKAASPPSELVEACLTRIDEVDAKIEAWAFLDREHALRQAKAADDQRKRGDAVGPLHGVPIGIKDIFDTSDYPTEFGSPLWAGRTPRRDAAAVASLRAAGAVIMGKTVTTEYAYFNPGKTRNPHDPERTPGGSSSGSAAAVAAGMVPGAIGSQTNGSVIRPAAFCGVVGFKPTHGLIPRTGALLLSRALDHVGVFARSVEDAALLAETLAGFDDGGSRHARRSPGRNSSPWPASEPPLPPRFAFVRTPAWHHAEPVTGPAFAELVEALGEDVNEIELCAGFERAIEMHGIVMAVEMAHNFHRDYEQGRDQLSPMLRALIEQRPRLSGGRLHARIGRQRAAERRPRCRFRRVRRHPDPSSSGRRRRAARQHGQPGVLQHLDLPRHARRDAAAAAGRGRHAASGCSLSAARGNDARLLRTARWLVKALERGGGSRAKKAGTAAIARKKGHVMMTFISGIIGIAMVIAFLGIMLGGSRRRRSSSSSFS